MQWLYACAVPLTWLGFPKLFFFNGDETNYRYPKLLCPLTYLQSIALENRVLTIIKRVFTFFVRFFLKKKHRAIGSQLFDNSRS